MISFISGALILIVCYLGGMITLVQLKRDTSIGNFTWGIGAVLLTVYAFFMKSSYHPRQILVTALLIAWVLRLGTYAYMRYKRGEDPRFLSWLQHGFWWSLAMNIGWVGILNGFMMLVMSIPGVYTNISANPPLMILDGLGLLIWIAGFIIESVADTELYHFRKNPDNKGKVMQEGLWHYSRHPNYFGEICMWWGIFCIVLSIPGGYLTVVAPLAITISLLFVTGVPWVEGALKNNPEYQEYKKRTSMIVPWWPKE